MVRIELTDDAAKLVGSGTIERQWTPRGRTVKWEILQADEASGDCMPSDTRDRLVSAIATAKSWLDDLIAGRIASIEQIAAKTKRSQRFVTMTLSACILAPDIVQAAVDGKLPKGFGVSRLFDLPSDWAQQRKTLGMR